MSWNNSGRSAITPVTAFLTVCRKHDGSPVHVSFSPEPGPGEQSSGAPAAGQGGGPTGPPVVGSPLVLVIGSPELLDASVVELVETGPPEVLGEGPESLASPVSDPVVVTPADVPNVVGPPRPDSPAPAHADATSANAAMHPRPTTPCYRVWYSPSMIRLQLAWIVSLFVVGGCSDDGTVGAGETGASAGSTSASNGSGGESQTMTSPTGTGGITTSDPTDETASTGNVGSGSTSLDSSASTSDEPTSGSGTGSGSGSTGGGSSSGGEPEFMPCYPEGGEDCPQGLECWTSVCCFGQGFCVDPDAGSCGGFLGEPCEDGLTCVIDLCVADGTGVCVSADFSGDVCMEQALCWQGCEA